VWSALPPKPAGSTNGATCLLAFQSNKIMWTISLPSESRCHSGMRSAVVPRARGPWETVIFCSNMPAFRLEEHQLHRMPLVVGGKDSSMSPSPVHRQVRRQHALGLYGCVAIVGMLLADFDAGMPLEMLPTAKRLPYAVACNTGHGLLLCSLLNCARLFPQGICSIASRV
jgi:hypothetical protein